MGRLLMLYNDIRTYIETLQRVDWIVIASCALCAFILGAIIL